MTQDADVSVWAHSLLETEERQQVLRHFAGTLAHERAATGTIHGRFAVQAAKTPGAMAVEHEGEGLTYAQVEARANQLARHLRTLGVGEESRVGVCVERSSEVMVALLGVLKAGAAYVPLDAMYPKERLAYMLEGTGASVVVTQAGLEGVLPESSGQRVRLDADAAVLAAHAEESLGETGSAEQLAYVLYTSGSTGRPKGVMVRHGAVLNLHEGLKRTVYQGLGAGSRVSLNAPLVFDASVQQWVQLLDGHCLCVVPEATRKDAEALVAWQRRNRVVALDCTPSLLRLLLAEGLLEGEGAPQWVVSGGEAIDEATWSELGESERTRSFNVYGPTECTVDATSIAVKAGTRPSLGGPLHNVRTYVLDAKGQPVPVGVPGELYLGGEGLARGYLGQPGLTAERFVPNGFSEEPGARLYRTGDKVRWGRDGTLEYLGRMDFQVKVRGFRIELGEVEAVLSAQAQVRDAVVVVREDAPGDKRLVAYVVATADAATLRSALKERLPEYMVPSAFVVLDALPLNASGKVDRNALPRPEAGAERTQDHVAPRNQTEQVLASIWEAVLGAKQVGIHDNFFELGGHSLLATQAMSRIRTAFNVELPLRALFEAPTVAGLALKVEAVSAASPGLSVPKLVASARTGAEPLSFAQQRLWLLDQLQPGSASYNLPATVRLTGALDIEALRRTFQELVRRHEALRTTFQVRDGQPVQHIDSTRDLAWDVVALDAVEASRREGEMRRRVELEARRPFDLSRDSLLRVTLLRLSEQDHVLVLVMHHIVSDGWSTGVLVREVGALYSAFSQGRPSPLPELPVQYADYAAWQRGWLKGEVLESQLSWWRAQLEGASHALELPTDRPRSAVQTFRGAHRSAQWSKGLGEQLTALARQEGATPFMVLLAAWQVLLARYSGQQDISVGTPIAGRNRTELEGLIGFFVNTLVIRSRLEGSPSFRQVLRQVKETTLGAYAHQEVPFEKLVEELRPERDLSRSPLFQVMFTLQNAESAAPQAPSSEGALSLRSLETLGDTAKFDLTLSMMEDPTGLFASLEFNTDLFDAATAERMLKHLGMLLEGLAKDADADVWDVSLLDAAERQQVLLRWNDTRVAFPDQGAVHERFAAQAARTPDALAVESAAGVRLTYGALEARSNRLARHLRALGVGPEVRVGLCVERSPEMVVGMLAVLKAGGAYVPLDPAHPRERLAYLLEDARMPVVLTQRSLREALPEGAANVLCLDSDWETLVAPEAGTPAPAAAGQLAYVIYTSGSTGRPKGVEVEHASLGNLVTWHQRAYGVTEEDRTTQLAGLAFDASVWEIWPTLTAGASLHLPPEEVRTAPAELVHWLTEQRITVAFLPTVLAEAVVAREWPEATTLRTLLTGGDRLHRVDVDGLPFQVVNHYGPTEGTVVSTSAVVRASTQAPPIGQPITNMRAYVLDARLRPVPVGVGGELYVAGAGVSRGYLRRPELTAERFLPDPFATVPGARLYRTGDRVRWLSEGMLEFLGRADDQVKVRGFRIEPGEIEQALSLHPAVRERVVVVQDDARGGKRLVAYVVGEGGATLETGALHAFLRDRLPEYMVPSAFVVLDALPLNTSGKVDRRALPAPETGLSRTGPRVAPSTPTEVLLASLWAQVLGVPQVGAEDSFFELGGHSLLATQAMSRIRSAFGVELPLRALFEAPTVSRLALKVDEAVRATHGTARSEIPALVPVARTGAEPLSFAQQRLWFLDQLQPGSAQYNLPAAIRLSGRLDVPALERTFAELVRRHEALRTTFQVRDGEPVQVITPKESGTLVIVDLSARAADAREAEVRRFVEAETARPFDLGQGPLFRSTLLTVSEQEHVLVLVMHHAVSDGWSMRVLVREVVALYTAFSEGRVSPLPELSVQYADYAAWQRGWLKGDVLEAQLSWWRQQLSGAPRAIELPTDRPRPAIQTVRGALESVRLPKSLEAAVSTLARQEGATSFMVLLAAWQVLLARYSGQQDVSVGTPIAGRNRTELEGLIGFFVNTLVLRTKLEDGASFRQVLAQVREMTLGAYAHQEVPFEKLVEELKPERDLSRSPLFQVMFTLQNSANGADESLPEGAGLALRPVESVGATAKFDLTLAMSETGQGFAASLEYNTDLYDAETAQRLLGHFGTLLDGLTRNADASVWELSLLETEERQQVLKHFAGTVSVEAHDALAHGAGTIHGRFAAQAAKTPEAMAVEHEGEGLTYAQVEVRANQLARHLRTLGVGEESRVGVCVERSSQMMVALLGVLKAGAAYVPLDAMYPKERLAYMLEGTGASVVVTQSSLEGVLPEFTGQRVRLDADAAVLAAHAEESLGETGSAEQLAYVLYTSGSTGRPKGVMVRHGAVLNLHEGLKRTVYQGLGAGSRVSLNAPLVFDASVQQWAQLLDGHCLCVVPEATRKDAEALVAWQRRNRVVALDCTPSLLRLLLAEGLLEGEGAPQWVVSGGEAIDEGMWAELGATERTRSFNVYGPTECTVDATSIAVKAGRRPSVGGPLHNVRTYVLDAKGQPVPVGVPGELYLGGEGLARGYLGQPGLTAERFVPDGFSEEPGARLYRTGDKVRWGRDGTLEYLGRMDFQVKVRGFRIELGEVESALGEQPQVRDAVVVVREDAPGDKRLVAYVVATADAATLRSALRERLPEYMVPSAFVVLDALPLNTSGKVDRNALPRPEAGEERSHEYVAPRTETEEVLARLWAPLLGVKQVGIQDSFFELGGHSLLATQAMSRIRTAFNVELPLRALFEAPTVAGLALKVDAARSAGHALSVPKLEAVARTGREPLSFAQQRLWLLDQLQPGSTSYNLPMVVRLSGALDVEALRRTFQELVRRHESLRTTFQVHDGQPFQVIAPSQDLAWSLTSLDGVSESQRETELRKQVGAEVLRPFDLSQGPLFRVTLVRLTGAEHVLVLAMHHIVSDGWSMDVLVREVGALYSAFAEGRPSPLPELAVQYADYAAWQRGWLKDDALEAQLSWWRQQLEGAPHALDLPTDRARPAVQTFHGATASQVFPKTLEDTVKSLARQEGATPFMVLLAAWQVLLARYSGQQDVSVGTPIAGRNRTELEGLIGFFVNTLVLRAKLDESASFRQVLRQVKETTLGAYAHQEVPFEKLVEELKPERDLSRSPLFQVMFTLQNVSTGSAEALPSGLVLSPVDTDGTTAKFDLNLGMTETGRGLSASLEYNTDLYDAETAQRLLGHLGTLLSGIARDADTSIWELPLLQEEERQQVLKHFAGMPARKHEGPETLHALFAAQAAKTPGAVAVVHEGAALSYAQVEARANQLARHLRTLGVGEESRVGVCVERTEAMVVALLGVLKAGAAYVPLDATYPKERLAYMLEGTGAPVVVTQSSLEGVLPEFTGQRVRLDADAKVLDGYSTSALSESSVPSQLAYVLYTSGSTGRPKGVAVTHASAVAFLKWATATFKAEQLKGVLAATSLNFDLSVFEVFAPLVSGGTVVVAENALALAGLKEAGRVTLLNTVPSAVAELVRSGGIPATVQTVNLAGEALPNRLVQALYGLGQVKEVNNLYGPTEDTTYSTHARVERGAKTEPRIGRPLEGTQAYVLDAKGQPVPVGVPGELYLGGEGLARGYLGQPGLTAERFVPDGFSEKPGARLYRTGDKVRWGRDGALEYLGRMDFQVKVRGFRIELGEVESALGEQPQVRDVVVVVREDAPGDKRLVAYVVAQAGQTADAATLRSALKGRLPEYMVPSAFVVLEALPLNANGKVDRKALPKPEAGAERTRKYVAPRTKTEEALTNLWAQVLGVKQVGIQDSFFELGGHSLLATQAVSRIRTAFNVELPLRALFEAPTVEELALKVESVQKSGHSATMPALVKQVRSDEEPLSFAQQRLWFLDQLQPGSAFYNLPAAVRLSGPLDVEALRRTFDELVRRHESLRTTFQVRDGQPTQVVAPSAKTVLESVDLEALPVDERETEAQRRAQWESQRPFDLSQGPLFRAKLLRLSASDHVLVLVMHHIVSDGWSMGVLVKEVGALYAAFTQGHGSPLSELPVQYADYAAWQRSWLKGDVLEAQLGWWRRQLEGAPPALELPTDKPRPAVQRFRGASHSVALPRALEEQVKALAQQEGVTSFMLLLAAWQVVLARYSGQQDVSVGTPIAGRNQTELEGLIGFFVNTLVLRTKVEGHRSFRQVLAQVREMTLGAYAHQEVPFEKLVEELKPERDLSRTPLFQVSFTLNTAAVGEGQSLPGGLVLRAVETEGATAKFDMTLAMSETGQGLAATLTYNTDLFEEGTAKRLLKHLGALLEEVTARPDTRIAEVALLRGADAQRVLVEWNQTAAEFPREATLHGLFEAQVRKTPEAVAIVGDEGTFSYRQVNEAAEALADSLRAWGVGPEVKVGLALERSAALVMAQVATLKAGGAWVPLDVEYPAERLGFMVEDSGVALVLAHAARAHELPATSARVVHVEDAILTAVRSDSVTRDEVQAPPDADTLAYVIYTSGSTGKPKGVGVGHRAVVNHLHWRQERFPMSGSDAFLAKASSSFDISVWEVWAPLVSGARLVLAKPGGQRDTEYLVKTVAEHGVTHVHFGPAPLGTFLETPGVEGCEGLRYVFCGGEALAAGLHRRFVKKLGAKLVHQYGPTEACIDCVAWETPREAVEVVPLGRPIANTDVYVVDEAGRAVPVGVAGELLVGGEGLARGYLGRSDLTAERFIPDGLSGRAGARLYRTGDKARWREDGTLEYLGRLDFQVKVRGYRIELGEVEAALVAQPGVREAVAVVREDAATGKRLVAYVVAKPGEAVEAQALRSALKQRLPEYLVPSALVVLDALPLNANGKVDRKALPAPEAGLSQAGRYEAPRTATEEVLAALWAQVLGVRQVGARDDFFELGGHSLLATQVVSRIRTAFGVEVPLRALFESPVLHALAERIEAEVAQGAGTKQPPLVARPRTGHEPLSFAQQRLWFLDQLQPGSALYNLPSAVRLTGRLDVAALERTFTELVRRHEALRTTFQGLDGEPIQVIAPTAAKTLRLIDLTGQGTEERRTEARRFAEAEAARPFDLGQGPLFRAALLSVSEEEHVLVLVMHHIVSDGWSMRVLVREVAALYAAYAEGRPSPLPELDVQYADYAAWQRGWLKGEVLETQIAWWRQQLEGAPRAIELPTDHPRPAVQTFQGANTSVMLPKALEEAVSALAREEGATSFMVLLAAWQVVLARYSGQQDISVGTPIAGRNRTELESLIGFFVNTLVLRTKLEDGASFRQVLRQVKETTLGAYAYQEVPFEKLVEELKPERDLSRSPLFQVMFTLQNSAKGPDGSPTGGEGLALREVDTGSGAAKFELSLAMAETGRGLATSLEYNTDLYDAETAQRMLGHLTVLLEGIAKDADTSIWELPLLQQEERQQVLMHFAGAPAQERAGTETVHSLFAVQAAKTPDAVAVVHEGAALTYAQVEARANQLARHLRTLGVGEESRVGVCVERSAEMVVALLGVLKAGAAYVPLDATYPKERLAYMLEGTGAPVVVTQAGLEGVLPEYTGQRVRLDADASVLAAYSEAAVVLTSAEQQLAYVLYTSGSTGRPKGVAVTHASAVAFLKWARGTFKAEQLKGVLAATSLNFDLSVFEVFAPLVSGGTVVVAENALALAGLKEAGRVTLLNTVPSAVAELVRSGGIPATVQTVNLAGEALPNRLVQALYGLGQVKEVNNLYGPTEDTTYSTHARVERGAKTEPRIGRPLEGTQAYVLDAKGRPVPVGVPGELYLGGEGLARGYLGQPGLTAERFVPDGFSEEPGARLYRTGDKVRWGRDGALEYLGRMDFQVKVRGFRIELGEVESALGEQPQVRDVVVVVREDAPGDKRLVAYVVAQAGQTADAATLRSALKGRLPEYMVPSAFVVLEALPLNANGKVDRKALPKPAVGTSAAGKVIAPRDTVELQLVSIWEDLLGMQPISVDADFFELGGHSLLAVRLMTAIRKRLGKGLPLAALFLSPTVERLAMLLRQDAAPSMSPLVTIQPEGSRPPLFCVHPAGGNVLSYVELSRQLGPDQPFYGLRSLGIEGEQEPLDSIEAMATTYVEAVRTVRPEGPYLLAGWSMGGAVAYEMARQLRAAGQTVALLALLDPGSVSQTGGTGTEGEQINQELAALFEEEPASNGPEKSPEAGAPPSRDELLARLLDEAKKAGAVTPDVELKDFRILMRVFELNRKATRQYVPVPHDGDITVFRASRSEDPAPLGRDRGWSALGLGGVKLLELEGDHYSILRAPRVSVLAEELRKRIAEALEDAASK
ncbi:non-ribosomal peptide synthase/polyketide synthase [Corallococcus soli]|uniref:non-ribosomal peptide synthase/polyketide synthase n=1 Tax=Corallococcus soli TaxID=2710757 RepID=UPI0034E2FFAB